MALMGKILIITGNRNLDLDTCGLQLKIAARSKNLGTFGNVPKIAIFDDWDGAKCLLMLRFDS